jgi:hypothetical protein
MRSIPPALRLVLAVSTALALVWAPSSAAWSWPVDGPVVRPFAFGADPYAGGQHRGVDVGAPAGGAVAAPADGVVSFSGTVPGGGRAVTIRTADGYSVTLVHLGSSGPMKGTLVEEGAQVGTVGPSGDAEVAAPYVHLGVRLTADSEGYVDPLGLLPARPAPAVPAPGSGEGPAEGSGSAEGAGEASTEGDPPAEVPPQASDPPGPPEEADPGEAPADGEASGESEASGGAGEGEAGAEGAAEAGEDPADGAPVEGGGESTEPGAAAPGDDPPVIDEPLPTAPPAEAPEAPAAAAEPPGDPAAPAAPATTPEAPAEPLPAAPTGEATEVTEAVEGEQPLELRGAFSFSSARSASWALASGAEPGPARRDGHALGPADARDVGATPRVSWVTGRERPKVRAADGPSAGPAGRRADQRRIGRVGRLRPNRGDSVQPAGSDVAMEAGAEQEAGRDDGAAGWATRLVGALALLSVAALLARRRRSRLAAEQRLEARIMSVLGGAHPAADPGRRGLAVRERPAAHRPHRGVRGPVRHLRAVPPPARERRPDGERVGRARDAGDGGGRQGRRLAA